MLLSEGRVVGGGRGGREGGTDKQTKIKDEERNMETGGGGVQTKSVGGKRTPDRLRTTYC